MGSTNLSSLTLLADTIKVNATVLDEYIARYHHIYPSLKVDGVSLSIASDDKEVLAARAALLSATRELRDVILGPVGILMNIGVGSSFRVSPSLYTFIKIPFHSNSAQAFDEPKQTIESCESFQLKS